MYRGSMEQQHDDEPDKVVFKTVTANGAVEPACTVQKEDCTAKLSDTPHSEL